MMIFVLLLQFVAANVGAHQLHESVHQQENDSHVHLLLDVNDWNPNAHQCLNEIESWQLVLMSDSHDDAEAHPTEPENTFDLCLDCQCHGMYVTLRSLTDSDSVFFGTLNKPIFATLYFPPENAPTYRPPIV